MKYLKHAWPFFLGIIIILVDQLLPEAVKSELGFIPLIVAGLFIVWVPYRFLQASIPPNA